MSITPGSGSRRYLLIAPALTLMLAFVLAGCGAGTQPEPTTPPSPTQDTGAAPATATVAGGTGAIDSAQALVDALGQAGLTVNDTGPIDQPFLSVKGGSYEAGSGYLQVFEYADQAAAEADAAKIKPDGSIEGHSVSWVATPHFYRMGRLIVVYLGDDTADLGALQTLLGDPFATGQALRLP